MRKEKSIREQIHEDIADMYYQITNILSGKVEPTKCNTFLQNHIKFCISTISDRRFKQYTECYGIRDINGDVNIIWFETASKTLAFRVISDDIDKHIIIGIPDIKDLVMTMTKGEPDPFVYNSAGIVKEIRNLLLYPVEKHLGNPEKNKCTRKMFTIEANLYMVKFMEMFNYDKSYILNTIRTIDRENTFAYVSYLYSGIRNAKFDDYKSLSDYMEDTFLRGQLYEKSWFENVYD